MRDANDTRQHVLLGRDWAERLTPGAVYDATRGELTLQPLAFEFPAHAADRPVGPADRRGCAADRFGTIYFVDATRTAILAQVPGDGSVGLWWPDARAAGTWPPPPAGAFGPVAPKAPASASTLGGVCVTTGHELVVGTLDPPGLLRFDLRGGSPPTQATWPADVPFAPTDLAARPGGGVAVLDAEHARLWRLDRTLAVEPAIDPAPPALPAPGAFISTGGALAPPTVPVRRPASADAVALAPGALAVEVLDDDTVLVLYRDTLQPLGRPAVALDGLAAHDLVWSQGELLIAVEQGDQAYAHALTGYGDAIVLQRALRYLPMRRHEGRGLVAGPAGAWYDSGGRWRELLCVGRPRHATEATVTSLPLDGREPGCVWHRVIIDADVPPGTRIAVDVRSAEAPGDLDAAAWQAQPAPLRRTTGTEVAWQRWETDYEAWELLIQDVRGRWAQVRLRLVGDGRATPRVRALRVWYPRFSYLERYLPHAYREDPLSASFLDRFLANVEGTFTALEDRVERFEALLDPTTAPAETLDWLATWFDVALDPAWDEARRRLFLRHAMTLFALRGTALGLQLALRLALDVKVDETVFTASEDLRTASYRIVERYRLRRTPGVVLGDAAGGTASGGRWDPTQGGDALDAAWGRDVPFPLTPPAGEETEWRAVALATLGFVPWAADHAEDPPGWTDFLARRYGHPAALAAAYGLPSLAAFADVAFPRDERPAEAAALRDWFAFEAVVLVMRGAAHRFTVLLPVCLDEDEAAERRKRDLAARVVEAQAPAHTTFDVRLYWSAFRVGEARVGMETVVVDRSRLGRLLGTAVLGASHLGAARLGGEGDVLHR